MFLSTWLAHKTPPRKRENVTSLLFFHRGLRYAVCSNSGMFASCASDNFLGHSFSLIGFSLSLRLASRVCSRTSTCYGFCVTANISTWFNSNVHWRQAQYLTYRTIFQTEYILVIIWYFSSTRKEHIIKLQKPLKYK